MSCSDRFGSERKVKSKVASLSKKDPGLSQVSDRTGRLPGEEDTDDKEPASLMILRGCYRFLKTVFVILPLGGFLMPDNYS